MIILLQQYYFFPLNNNIPHFHDVLLEVYAIHRYIIIFFIFLTTMEGVVNVEWHGQDYLHLKWHVVCSGLATPVPALAKARARTRPRLVIYYLLPLLRT